MRFIDNLAEQSDNGGDYPVAAVPAYVAAPVAAAPVAAAPVAAAPVAAVPVAADPVAAPAYDASKAITDRG